MNCLIPITNTFSDIRRALPVLNSLNELIEMLSNHKYDISKMVPSILDLVSSYPFSIKSFPLIEKGYSRTILHREPNGFEVMVARWSRHAKTPIHGHPGFSVLYLIEGELSEQSFIKEKDQPIGIDSRIISTGDYSCDKGVDGRFDNAIHQIRATQESLSLHIYSDDALKGEIYPT